MHLLVQACYGHTEGAAGVTGAFLAVEALRNRTAPGITGLRETNPYVAAALADWRRRSGRSPLLPRGTTLHGVPSLAGEKIPAPRFPPPVVIVADAVTDTAAAHRC